MSNALFINPDDNLSPVATGGVEWVVQAGAVDSDPDYGLTKLGDLDAATPCKCTTVGPFAVVRDLGSAKRVDVAIVPMHSCDAGGTVRFQMHSSSSWGTPDVDVTCVVPTWSRAMPLGLFFDLRSIAEATRTRRYVRVSAPANATRTLSLGEVVFGVATAMPRNVNWGLKLPEEVPTITSETPTGARMGVRVAMLRRNISAHVDTTDAGFAQIEELYQTAANVVPFGFVLDPSAATPAGYGVRFAYFDGKFEPTLQFLDLHGFDLLLTEQARGRVVS